MYVPRKVDHLFVTLYKYPMYLYLCTHTADPNPFRAEAHIVYKH